jgi:hypothetical protein
MFLDDEPTGREWISCPTIPFNTTSPKIHYPLFQLQVGEENTLAAF